MQAHNASRLADRCGTTRRIKAVLSAGTTLPFDGIVLNENAQTDPWQLPRDENYKPPSRTKLLLDLSFTAVAARPPSGGVPIKVKRGYFLPTVRTSENGDCGGSKIVEFFST
jgi:hypothetical protein